MIASDLLHYLHRKGRWPRAVDLPKQIAEYHRIPPTVMYDLADFCDARAPAPPTSDMFAQGRAAGRRDVWLRIEYMRNLTDEQVFRLLHGEFIEQQPQGE